jgi:small subunit ribosomal protein S4e
MKQVGRFAVSKVSPQSRVERHRFTFTTDETSSLMNHLKYNTGDSLKFHYLSQEVIEHIKFGEGVRCYLIGGTHVGEMASMKEYIKKRSSMPNEVAFDEFGTTEVNVFAVGDASIPAMEVKA